MADAPKRDFLDDIIDITGDLQAIGNPLNNLANTLAAEPGQEPTWNPADYKKRPRANVIPCTSCRTKDPKTCQRCVEVCPVDAITLDEGAIEISDTCIKCGLCVEACPNECYSVRELAPRYLYDEIAAAAMSHETAYVTCTRAIGRLPEKNEVIVPCVGVVPSEVWASIMADYPNVSVFLPLGLCETCRTKTGEEAYTDAIGRAEEWCGFGLGLEVDEGDLTHEVRREWQRQEFMDTIVNSGQRLLTGATPALSIAQRVTQQIRGHTAQLNRLSKTIDQAMGGTTSKNQRRILLDRRKLLMAMLQKHPSLAENIDLYEPVCDPDLCTLCGACEKVCPTRAIELTPEGRWRCENAYCTQCGACFSVCPTSALEPDYIDASDLVLPDDEVRMAQVSAADQKADIERLKAEGMKALNQGLDFLERLGGAAAGAGAAGAGATTGGATASQTTTDGE